MTSAGAAQVAFVKESSFATEPGTPTYYLPGRNPTVEELSIDNLLTRLRQPGNVEAVDSLVGNFEGAYTISYITSEDTHDDVRDIVFNDGGTGFTTGLAATSSWYVGSKYLNTSDAENTVERNLTGCTPLQYEIRYQQGQPVRESLTLGVHDESRNTTFTPGSITKPTDGNDVGSFGATLTVDNSTVSRLRSFTLRFNNISRYIRDPDRHPATAIMAAPETTLEFTTDAYHTNDYLEIAYGGATGNTSPQTTLSKVSNSDVTLDSGGTSFVTYTLSELVPRNYSWQDLVNADENLSETLVADVNGGISIA